MDYDRDTSDVNITVNVHPLPQKSGKVLDGGDCGYCCLAGIFQLPTTLKAYEFIEEAMPEKGGWKRRQSLTAYRTKMLLEFKGFEYNQFQPAFDHYKEGLMENPWNNLAWINEFQELVGKGTVLLASIRYKKSEPPPPRSHLDHDHNVIVNGYRQYFVKHKTVPNCRSQVREVRVSCSARNDSYWIDWEDFIYWHGCASVEIPQEIHGQLVVRDGVYADTRGQIA